MAGTGRWMAAIAAGLAALAGCTALANIILPWDTATNISVGGAAGVVIGAFLALWAASWIERAAAHEQAAPPGPAPVPSTATTRQKVGEGLGFQIAPSGTGSTTFKDVTFNVNTPAPPSATPPPDAGRAPGHGDGVVPPKA